MRADRGEEETPLVDMAPMIDCVFLLLIFFLVAATIRKQHQEFPVELPAGETAVDKKAEDETLVITVFRQGEQIQYAMTTIAERTKSGGGAREVMTWQQLVDGIEKRGKEKLDRSVRIDADSSIPYGRVSMILDHLALNDLKTVGFRTRGRIGE